MRTLDWLSLSIIHHGMGWKAARQTTFGPLGHETWPAGRPPPHRGAAQAFSVFSDSSPSSLLPLFFNVHNSRLSSMEHRKKGPGILSFLLSSSPSFPLRLHLFMYSSITKRKRASKQGVQGASTSGRRRADAHQWMDVRDIPSRASAMGCSFISFLFQRE